MEAAGWQRHQVAAAYLAHLRRVLAADAAQLPEVSTEWLTHAEQAVAELDPTRSRLTLLQEGCNPDWASAFGRKLVDDERPMPSYM